MFSDVPLRHLNKVSRTEESFICPSVTRQLRAVRGNIRHLSSNCSSSEVTQWGLCITHKHVSHCTNTQTYWDNNVCPWKSKPYTTFTCFLFKLSQNRQNHILSPRHININVIWVIFSFVSVLPLIDTNDAYGVMCFSVVFDEILRKPLRCLPPPLHLLSLSNVLFFFSLQKCTFSFKYMQK